MEVIEYNSIFELRDAAEKYNKGLLATKKSISFRVFKNKKCIELHIFKLNF